MLDRIILRFLRFFAAILFGCGQRPCCGKAICNRSRVDQSHGLVPWMFRFSHYPIAGYLPPSARSDHLSGRAEGEELARRRRVAKRLIIHGTSPWD